MMLAEATPVGSHLNLQKRREVLQENARFAQQIRALELTYGKIAAQQKSLISALENGMSSFKTTPLNTQTVENLQDVRKSYDVLLTRDIGAVQQRKSHHTEVLETLLNAVEDLKVLRDSTKADLVEPIFYTEMTNAERERTADLLANWKTLLKDENDLSVLHTKYPKTPFRGITSERPWYSLDPRDAARFGGILSLIPVTLDIAKQTHRVVQTVASGEKSMLQKDSLKLPSVLSDLVKLHPNSSEAELEPTRVNTQRRKWEKPNVFGEDRPEVTYRRAASAVSDVQDNDVAAPKRKQWSKDPLSLSTPAFLSNPGHGVQNPHNPGHGGQKPNPGVHQHNGKGNPGTPISSMPRVQRQGMQGMSAEDIRVIVKDMIAPLSVQIKANSEKLQDVEGQVRQCSARLTKLSEHQAGLALKVFEAIRKDLEEHLNTNIRDIIKTEMAALTPRSTEEIR
ncbi:Hypp6330 [Branchiostoma lanceolatum]|uniref:Hypp6330 protein n=1 Tax=Branchiostoma lanceolatum TaxID=7740 RepID=A0A8J9YT34_BRALA|nr:Hypp6330 [Branchiostoma lanceolatum]